MDAASGGASVRLAVPPSIMRVLVLALLVGLVVHVQGTHVAHSRSYWQHEQRLDRDGVVVLRWNSTAFSDGPRPDPVGGSNAGADGVLQLEVAARTRGYVGLGLSPYTGTMAGADLVIAWVDDAGIAHARDYWADQNGSPTLDKTQDWLVIGAMENDTHTVVRLARPLRTRHVMDVTIQPGPIRIIFSWSGADPGRVPHYHGKEQRGVSVVRLLADSASAPARSRGPEAGVWAWTLPWLSIVGAPVYWH